MDRNGIALLDSLLRAGAGHVHMLGVCGVGMAGLAVLLKEAGLHVTGCDWEPGRLAEWLRGHGIDVKTGHDPGHCGRDVDLLVRTAAVPEDHIEVLQAREREVPVLLRGQVLPVFVRNGRSIAVSGTHGKTTTASFTAQILVHAGRDPSWCIGGECEGLAGVANAGGGEAMVVEADESDGTVAGYRPETAVVTNIEFDHMEHFPDRKAFEACFRAFIGNARRGVVFCRDDPVARRVCGRRPGALSYGFSARADLRAVYVREEPGRQRFTVRLRGQRLGRVTLPVPGRHNALNALAAMGAALAAGVPFETIAAAVPRLRLPRRRFERIVEEHGVSVVSDYAHHPSEIAALVRMARLSHPGRILAVFQPHRYTRTAALGADFPGAFAGVDALTLVPVYAASESPLAGGTVSDLYGHFRAAGGVCPLLASGLEAAWMQVRESLRPGDLLLVVGAGSVDRIAGWVRDCFHRAEWPYPSSRAAELVSRLPDSTVREREPLAPKTTLGAGGHADLWVEAGTEPDLTEVCRWSRERGLPFRILGGGSNVLVSDLGLRGITAQLGAAFGGIREEAGCVVAGAAVPLARLLAWTGERGKAGLEFLEGIPGTVGGAARMNAGAWGEEIGNRIARLRCVREDGAIETRTRTELGFAYRACAALAEAVAVEVAFDLSPGEPDAMARRRAEFRERRRWMRDMRSAGSIFRNPPGRVAGRMLEAIGMKGMRIGGATVAEAHANVIRADSDVTASDIRALIEIGRMRVEERYGIRLETEMVLWE